MTPGPPLLQLAQPWWVNLLLLVPPALVWWGRRYGHDLSGGRLASLALWAAAFGGVEAAVVIDLRAIYVGMLGEQPTLLSVARVSADPMTPLVSLPQDLLNLEMRREGATLVMLAAVAVLAAHSWSNRVVAFLWAFAIWDMAYYASLWWEISWPASPLTVDVLFLIPCPWIAPTWFPLLVSGSTAVAVFVARRRGN